MATHAEMQVIPRLMLGVCAQRPLPLVQAWLSQDGQGSFPGDNIKVGLVNVS